MAMTVSSMYSDKALVSFLVVAYNQENYIREAIEGAFAQTYKPLEIILSDDCSTDRTFEIMQEMAKAYQGPHRVCAVQTDHNLGVTPHVLLRGKQATGEVVVLAAGDDISKAVRCEQHVNCYKDDTVLGVSSSYDLIDKSGDLISFNNKHPVNKNASARQRKLFKSLRYPYAVIQGATASYRRQVFHFNLPGWDLLFSEDNLFNFLIYLHGYRVAILDEASIRYRQHDNALSNKPRSSESIQDQESQSLRAARKEANKMRTYYWLATNEGGGAITNTREIERRKKVAELIVSWPEKPFALRVVSILRSILLGQVIMLKWKSARIFGQPQNYQPLSTIKT